VWLCLALAACGGGGTPSGALSGRTEASLSAGPLPPPVQCAPFVREIAGIPLHGDAWSWWDQAGGRFDRGAVPRVGAVLVLRSTEQLPFGHVAIVRRVFGPREIAVTHSDWGNDDSSRRLIHDAMPVVDISPANDWSQLRFWNAAGQAFGRVYPAYGFIYPREIAGDLQAVR
jgi:hypothetical protein